jgi:parvulin-like peptidyl-prolyl isomerase
MLDGVRNNLLRGWPLIIIISVCALPFVFLGTGSLGTVFGSNYGSVNGEQVDEIDIQVAQNRVIQNYKDIFGDDFDFGLLPQDQQAQALNDEIIRQKVLLAEVRSLGLLNKEEINSAKKEIIKNQDFYVDGSFDEGRFEAFVNANGFTKDAFIEILTRIEATNKYTQSITSNFVTDEEVKDFIKLIEKTLDVSFIKVSYEDILNSVSSSLVEQNNYYLNNKDSFLSDEKRSLKYFKLSKAYFSDLINIPEDYYERAYEEYVQEVNNSKQKKISHIMIDKGNYDDESEAFNAINAVNERLINGAKFEDLVKEYSEDLLTKDSNGDLDYFSADLFPIEFANELENLSLNQTSSVINLESSLHILKVTEIYQDELLSFEDKKQTLEEDLIEAESLALLNEEYFKILDLIDSNSNFADIQSQYTSEILNIEAISYANFSNIDLTPYKDEIYSSGDEINVKSNNEELIVYIVDNIYEPIQLSFIDVQEEINNTLNNEKAFDIRENILLQLESLGKDDFVEFAEKYNYLSVENFVNVKSNASILPREVINELFVKELNSKSLISSADDYYYVVIDGIELPTDENIANLLEEYKSLSLDQVNNKIFAIINDELYSNLRNDLRIGVN